jgi:hypothetical protein
MLAGLRCLMESGVARADQGSRLDEMFLEKCTLHVQSGTFDTECGRVRPELYLCESTRL